MLETRFLKESTMTKLPQGDRPSAKPPRNMNPEIYERLKVEAAAPYRGLRRFVYYAIAGSGLIGGVVFIAKLAAGQDVAENLPNLAVQAGVVGLMVWLLRLENKVEEKDKLKGDRS
jgi:Low psii accumulation1 / Rep27